MFFYFHRLIRVIALCKSIPSFKFVTGSALILFAGTEMALHAVIFGLTAAAMLVGRARSKPGVKVLQESADEILY
jgi:hypothetical protein